MDRTDIKILGLLQEDGASTNAGVARRIGVSEETVRRRIKRMTTDGEFRIVAIPDPEKVGFKCQMIMGIQVMAEAVVHVATSLAKREEITWVHYTTGSFDLMIQIMLRDMEEYNQFLGVYMRSIPGILRTEIFMVLETEKQTFRLPLERS